MTNPDDRPSDMEILDRVLYDASGHITKDLKKAVTGNVTIRNADGTTETVRLVSDLLSDGTAD